jgi:predicted component of type VI protein secretion system
MAATAGPRTQAILKMKVPGRTRLIVFDTQDLTLGRSPENDLSVDDPEMSRKHAVFKRSREGCLVEDMGTSNGTVVNGQAVARAVLKHGDVVKIGEVEITYAETTRAAASLGATVEYASQLKAFGTPLARASGDGEATILGMMDAPAESDDEDFEVRPAGDFDFDLHGANAGKPAPRDLDAEVGDLDLDDSFAFGDAKTQAPARAPKPPARPAAAPRAPAPARPAPAPAPAPARSSARNEVWELESEPDKSSPAAGPLAVTLEIDGLPAELRRALEGLFGKVIELPNMRVRIKGRDLG